MQYCFFPFSFASKFFFFLVLFFLPLFPFSAEPSKSTPNVCPSQNSVSVTSSLSKIDLSSYLSVALAPKPWEPLDFLPQTLSFAPNGKNAPNFGIQTKEYFFCFRVSNDSNTALEVILNANYPNLDTIVFWIPSISGEWIATKQGRISLPSARDFQHRGFNKKFIVPQNRELSIFIFVSTEGPMSVPLQLYSVSSYISHITNDNLAQGFYFGIITVMLFYNLFLFLSIKERAYFFYVIYLFLASILWQASMNGHLSLWLFAENPILGKSMHHVFYFLFIASGFWICIVFFEMKQFAPRFYPVFLVLFGLSLICLVLMPFVSYGSMDSVGDALTLVLALLALVVSFRVAFLKRYRPARYFFVAFFFVILGGLATLFKFRGLMPVNYFTNHSFQISMAFEVILMAFGLGDRIKLIQAASETLQIKSENDKQKLYGFQKELELAQKLQKSTLPQKIPQIQNLQISARYLPASLVGGDFYDLTRIDYHRLSCLIADVTGHGIPAAIEAAMLKIAYSQNTYFAELPGIVLERINQSLVGTYNNQLLTATAFFIDSFERSVTIANAGHPALYWLKQDTKTIEKVRPSGKIIGFSKDCKYDEEVIHLGFYDKILVYSDGLWDFWGDPKESSDGEDQFIAWLEERIDLDHQSLFQEIEKKISSYQEIHALEDDVTYLLFSFLPPQTSA